jgi:hypothetical protein
MSVLTDIIVVDSSQVDEVIKALAPAETYAGFDAKGLDPVTLGTLQAILAGQGPDAADEDDELLLERFPLLAQESDDGPWLYGIPGELVTALSRLSDADKERAVAAWTATEECSDWEPALALSLVDELAKSARRAVDEKKQMMMWVCL